MDKVCVHIAQQLYAHKLLKTLKFHFFFLSNYGNLPKLDNVFVTKNFLLHSS